MNVLYTLPLDPEQLAQLEELGLTVHQCKESGPFPPEALEAEVLVTFNAFAALDIADMPNLRYIQIGSTGMNQVPLSAVERGIQIANNPRGFAIPIGEWIVTKILESYKNTKAVYEQQRNKVWKQDFTIEEVGAKKALFIGTGNIAAEGAKRLACFDVDIVGVNRSGKTNDVFTEVIAMDQLKQRIGEFDIIVAVLPGTKETDKLIGRELIEAMKEGSVFVNISRGSVVDQSALTELAGKFRAVHLDVFEIEPLPQEDPLWDLENVFVSSHTSWGSSKTEMRRFAAIYENLQAYVAGEELPAKVDLLRGY